MKIPSLDDMKLLTYTQRVIRAADWSVGPLKEQSAARTLAARIQPGEKRRWSQYNTDDYPHQGSGLRSACQAAIDYGVATSAVQQVITIMRRAPELIDQLESGKISICAAYKAVRQSAKPLTPLTRHVTLETLLVYVRDINWTDKLGRRRVPSARRLRQEGVDIDLFNSLWHPCVEAHRRGKLQEFVDAAREML